MTEAGICACTIRCSVLVVAVISILLYFALRPATFVIETEVFIHRPAEDVYKGLSDLRNSITYHRHRKELHVIEENKDGIPEKVYEITDYIPIYGSLEIPITYNVTMEFTKPNRELRCDFSINAYALIGRNTWYLLPGEDQNGSGTRLKEEFEITCPWMSSHFTEYTARLAHNDLLSNIKVALEQRVI
ncbi:uncharacterized protein [Amphiura filiformis]|uniref:uncharacterized protein n=1 Tax=Amphiura filiformis TaxID=82378 RepID=UPI003B221808